MFCLVCYLGVRSLLIPLSIQQSKSSEYIKLLKPYTQEIKERFKDNEDARNRATAKLYEDANQNPLSGCLLSLAQLPIFLGLYRGVRLLALDGKLEEPFLWIPSLQGPVTAETDFRGIEWLTQGWQQIDGTWTPSLGWETTLAFCVMPIILVLGQSLTMKVLQPPVDEDATDEEKEQLEKTQGFLKFLPLLIGFFSLQVPAGLTIYWFTSNAFTLTQSLAVRKYYELNPPEINLPDYWDSLDKIEELSADEKRKVAAAGIAVGPKFEDLIVEANFHTVVERTPLRADSAAWQRVASANGNVPPEMKTWVGTLNGSSASPSNGEHMNGVADPATSSQEQAVPTSA
jgi:YidC/Oxa1 family membrane protein insertase